MNRPTLVLHGGFHKTATSHIQSLLARNSRKMARAGVTYLHHRDTRKRLTVPVQCNVYNAIGMDWDPKIPDQELARMTAEFFDEIMNADIDRVILSDENMAGHCGHCIKRGMLYRWHRRLINVFAEQFPHPVSEVYLGVRNYADFFASAYVEYLRSVSGQWFVDEPIMRKQILENMPSWHNVLKSVVSFFPDAQIVVWRYEDFRKLDARILALICGPTVDVTRLKEPKNKEKRPTASGRAVSELLQLIHGKGAEFALNERVALQEKYPRGKEFGPYDPWSASERAHLTRTYERDIAEIEANPGISLLRPGEKPGEGGC